MSPARYRRALSPMERYCLVINRLYRYHVDAVVEGIGSIDPAHMQAAVTTAAAANPGVRVRLRGALGFAAWVDSGRAPQVRVVDADAWDGSSERGAEFMARRFDPSGGGPVAEVVLARGADRRTRVVFRGLHAAFDGRGMLHWVTEVFRALRGEPLLGAPATLTDLEVQDQYRDRVAHQDIPAPTPCLAVLDHGGAREPLAYVWRRVLMPRRIPNLLAASAVFLAAWARRRESGDVGFTIPIDYRGLRTDAMSVGNLTGYVRLNIDPADTPRTLMRQLRQRLDTYADCRQAPDARRLLWIPLWYLTRQLQANRDQLLYRATPHLPSGGIVSMGTVRREWYSCPGFDAALIYGIPGAVGKLNLVFASYPDFTVATFAAPAAYNHQGQLDTLVGAYGAHFAH